MEPLTGNLNPEGPIGPTLLIVEDNPVVRECYAEFLGQAGYKIDMAEDGEIGWQKACDGTYSLIITDHDMPRLTGLGFISRLKKDQNKTPIILISGTLSPTDVRLPGLGLFALVPKPFVVEVLLEKIEQAVGKQNRRDEAPSSDAPKR